MTKTCTFCNLEATTEVKNLELTATVPVCDDHLSEVMNEAFSKGEGAFSDWAIATFGEERGDRLIQIAFAEEEQPVRGDDNERMIMFTYGILKHPWRLETEGATDIVEGCTVDGHKMYLYSSAYPITTKSGNNNDKIYGTLFSIPRWFVESNYDKIEGYDPRRHYDDNMYNRIKVDVKKPNGEIVQAEMYYANEGMFYGQFNKQNYIRTGNFDDARLALSYGREQNKWSYGRSRRNRR